MNPYPCKIRINRSALKEYLNLVVEQPDTLVAMSKFILMLASTRIWNLSAKKIYDLHGLVGKTIRYTSTD